MLPDRVSNPGPLTYESGARNSGLTFTFNLPEQIFQMTLLLLKDNNLAKLFRSPCINVQVMSRKT